MTKTVSAAELQALLDDGKPLLIDFFGRWPDTGEPTAPSLLSIAAENPDLRVVKLAMYDEPAEAVRFQVRPCPTLVLVKGPVTVRGRLGTASMAELRTWVAAALGFCDGRSVLRGESVQPAA